ncbi:FxsA family protein [Amaricoccus solimangrovi]|uniref:FxsA family protein n=1 Tax=Amaricoccus solimangrovi TaxID=2589815 RepID=A0A501WWM7_9RHOB|nr:FxsA family protein [Amaricoccus solimangrovi]TPE52544.1 FxsA family protein [Amaricoccus solimangrovi]
MPLLLLLVSLPLIEIALFVQIGGAIGLWPTLALVIASSLGGMAVMRRQGTQALMRLSESMERGGDPAGPLAHGALVMIAGILLIIPGFFTSACGILLLIPPIRRWLIGRGASGMTVRAARFRRAGPMPPRPGASRPGRPGQPGTIDAEYEVIEEHETDGGDHPRRGASGWTRPH